MPPIRLHPAPPPTPTHPHPHPPTPRRRISHPKQRSRSIFISDSAIVARRDGILKFMFRVADIRRTQVGCIFFLSFLGGRGDIRCTQVVCLSFFLFCFSFSRGSAGSARAAASRCWPLPAACPACCASLPPAAQVVDPKIKAFMYTWGEGRVTAEGERIPGAAVGPGSWAALWQLLGCWGCGWCGWVTDEIPMLCLPLPRLCFRAVRCEVLDIGYIDGMLLLPLIIEHTIGGQALQMD